VLVVRTGDDARAAAPAVLQAIRELDPNQPVYDVRTMDEVLTRSSAHRWLSMAVVTAFAVSALLLAGVGLYGAVAYGVAQRMREFGIRLALGAARPDIVRLVINRGVILAACGGALGFGGAVALTVAMKSLLFGVEPLDPLGFITAVALLFAVAFAASYFPARRAALTNPTLALRAE
jgi:ABC-type antimicrobial peptide transport system permease subunit